MSVCMWTILGKTIESPQAPRFFFVYAKWKKTNVHLRNITIVTVLFLESTVVNLQAQGVWGVLLIGEPSELFLYVEFNVWDFDGIYLFFYYYYKIIQLNFVFVVCTNRYKKHIIWMVKNISFTRHWSKTTHWKPTIMLRYYIILKSNEDKSRKKIHDTEFKWNFSISGWL